MHNDFISAGRRWANADLKGSLHTVDRATLRIVDVILADDLPVAPEDFSVKGLWEVVKWTGFLSPTNKFPCRIDAVRLCGRCWSFLRPRPRWLVGRGRVVGAVGALVVAILATACGVGIVYKD